MRFGANNIGSAETLSLTIVTGLNSAQHSEQEGCNLLTFKDWETDTSSGFDVILLEVHKAMLQEMILRDKNHPSVIMWSLANEPRTDKPEAEDYFRY
ncbi:unnamed protein product, partial [Timema podura]|nr:unnamed protein product [Timema podura]